jgi:tetratricopeptide (TPR) repeat protein
MIQRTASSIVTILVLSALLPSASWGQKSEVKTYEAYEQIDEHNQLPLDPYPTFGLLTGYICYPYQFYGSKQFQVTPRRLRLLVAENEYLKIAMCPDYGGRLYSVYDKVRKREVIHRIYTAAKFYNAGMGYQYVDGGLELNLPNAHSQTNARPRECLARRNADGSVSLIMNNTEKIGRIHWSVAFTLSPGEARVRQDVRIANESAVEARYLYWANCGIPLKDNTEYIYPETKGAMHGKYDTVFSWPTYEGANLALIKNLDEMLGVYMLEAREGFFGYFSHDDKAGLAHYADVNDLPGKKYWSWGWHEDAQHTRFTHTDGVTYGEVQAGRIVIQEKFDRLPPLTSQSWTEFWYPVGDIGVFNGASENAAVRFSVGPKSETQAVAEIAVQAAARLRGVSLVIKRGDETIKVLKEAALAPERPLALTAEFACPAADFDRVSLEIRRSDGRLVAEVWAKARKAKPFDSYFIPEKQKTAAAEDFSAEGVFAKENALAADWFYHLPRQKKLLEECLRIDPGFSRAHTELGLMAFQAGRFKEALGHFDQALARVPDDGRTLYYKGLALRYLDRPEDAHYFLRHAGRFGYEAPGRVAEAEMAIRRGDWREADRHLARAIAANGTVAKGYILRACVEDRLGEAATARRLLEQAASLDPENSLVLSVRAALDKASGPAAELVRTRYRSFPEEPLEAVASLYSAGLFAEAYAILGLIENNNPISRLYRSELESILNRNSAPRSGPERAVDFAWRLEEYLILQRQLKLHPESGELYYHLGNFAYAHDLEEDGVVFWEKAYSLGYKDKVSLYSLYRAEKKLRPAQDKFFTYLEEALKLDPNDAYLFDDYVAEVKSRQGAPAAIELLEANIGRFMNCFTTCGTLLNEYLLAGAYDKFEAFAGRINMPYFWRASFGRTWAVMKIASGYRKLREKKYQEALADFEGAGRVPENLEKNYLESEPIKARRLFYIGYCRSKLGNEAGAAEAWTAALDIRRHVRFETSYNFTLMQARYYQAFCLRGLGRPREADVYIQSIKEFASSSSLANATAETKRHLLDLAYFGLETNLDNFDRFDRELGITTFASMATSVED